jgi:hypothetical protein
MKATEESLRYAQMGMAALIPRMQHMIDRMQAELDEMREHLAQLQQNGDRPGTANGRRAQPAKRGWAGMTAAERSTEMLRRMEVRKKNQAGAPTSPVSKNHPDHAQWTAKMARARKRAWNSKSPAEKKKWQQAMQAGRRKHSNQTAREAVEAARRGAAA